MKDNKLVTILVCVNLIIGIITLGGVGYLVINNNQAMDSNMPGDRSGMPDGNFNGQVNSETDEGTADEGTTNDGSSNVQ